jgi:hypothetical protein
MRRLLLAAVLACLGTVGAMVGYSLVAPVYAEQTGNGGGD